MYNDPRQPRMRYRGLSGDQQADKCTECEECMELCPQNIEIPEWLKKVDEFLGPRKF